MSRHGHSPMTPTSHQTPSRNNLYRRFQRRPNNSSQKSSSKKLVPPSPVKDTYIKSPGSMKRDHHKDDEFFVTLAESIIKTEHNTLSNRKKMQKEKLKESSNRTTPSEWEDQGKLLGFAENVSVNSLKARVRSLEAQLQLKNHQASILSSECQRLKVSMNSEKQRRKKVENEKHELQKQIKQLKKSSELIKKDIKGLIKQNQSLSKQIQFFQRINFDQKTRSLQSYREIYLEEQMQKMRKQYKKSKGERQSDLQIQVKSLKQEKYNIQSHFKAMKVANECLIKQINNYQQGLQDIVLNSQQYTKLRDKYVRFLQQYKIIRNQYWNLKAEINKKGFDESDLFSITISEVQADLLELRGNNDTSNILST